VFVDLQADRLEEVGGVDVVFDVIRGQVLERWPRWCAPVERWSRSSARRRCGPPTAGRPSSSSSRTRLRLADLAQRVRSGRLQPIMGAVRPLAEVSSAFAPDRRVSGKTIIQVTEAGNGRRIADRPAGRPGRPALTGDQGRAGVGAGREGHRPPGLREARPGWPRIRKTAGNGTTGKMVLTAVGERFWGRPRI
jgi:hypothetical protein